MDLPLIPVFATLSTLVVASLYDIKYREIPEHIWLPALIISLITLFIVKVDLIVLAISLIPALILFVLSLIGMMGGADFLAILLVGISTPYLNVIPISFLTLLYSALIPLFTIIHNAVDNLIKYKQLLNDLKCRTPSRVLLIFLGRPMRVSDYVRSRFMYPLTLIRCSNGDGEVICRTSFNINEDYRDHIKNFRTCLSKGVLSNDDYIWVTPAFPHIVFIAAGYVLSLITPSHIIYTIFSSLINLIR